MRCSIELDMPPSNYADIPPASNYSPIVLESTPYTSAPVPEEDKQITLPNESTWEIDSKDLKIEKEIGRGGNYLVIFLGTFLLS